MAYLVKRGEEEEEEEEEVMFQNRFQTIRGKSCRGGVYDASSCT